MPTDYNFTQQLTEKIEETLSETIQDLIKDTPISSVQDFVQSGEYVQALTKKKLTIPSFKDIIPEIQLTDNFSLNSFIDDPIQSIKQINKETIGNLQNTAYDVGEKLISEFGDNFNLLSGLQVNQNNINSVNDISGHFFGQSVDIFLGEFGQNVFPLADDIGKMLKGKVSQIGIVYDLGSWIHLSIKNDSKYNVQNALKFTMDKATGEFINGQHFPIRGIF